ncbi:hypothetical protein BH11MYX3_BH11MYX3_24000 [soil metagenome]
MDLTAVEGELRTKVAAGALDDAAGLAISSYGAELLGFLRATSRDDDLADEAFAIASEQLWKHLASFRWEALVRTWFYQLGRNALHQLRVDPRRRRERNLPFSLVTSIEEVHRQPTPAFQRTEVKQALRELRDRLEPLDHELLILRLDRSMSWKDIARALTEDEAEAAGEVERRAASLRKRYERIKLELRELAIARGLLESRD